MKETSQNGETKTHSPDFKAKVALEAIREEMTMMDLVKKYGVHSAQVGTWKQAVIDNMTAEFCKHGSDPRHVDDTRIDKPLSKIG